MQKKIILSLGVVLVSLSFSYAQRNTSSNSIRPRNYVVVSSESSNRGDCVPSPYASDDPAYLQTIAFDPYCCETEWDDICDNQYQYFLNGCDAESPYDSTDVNYITVVLLDDFCCSNEWDAQCQLHYEHVVYGCNAYSPYGPSDPIWEQVVAADQFCCNNEWDAKCEALYVSLSSPASLTQIEEHQFVLFPNPANNFVWSKLGNNNAHISSIRVYNNSGVLVMEINSSESEVLINTEDLNAGTYHIEVTTASMVLQQKLVLIK
jgi:hypothetical protein